MSWSMTWRLSIWTTAGCIPRAGTFLRQISPQREHRALPASLGLLWRKKERERRRRGPAGYNLKRQKRVGEGRIAMFIRQRGYPLEASNPFPALVHMRSSMSAEKSCGHLRRLDTPLLNNMPSNKIGRANAGGPRQGAIRTRWAARVAHLCRSAVSSFDALAPMGGF